MEERRERRGVSNDVEIEERSTGNVDPMGSVSSGIQTGPLRGADEPPVASTDEAMRRARAAGGLAGEEGSRTGRVDIREKYGVRDEDEE